MGKRPTAPPAPPVVVEDVLIAADWEETGSAPSTIGTTVGPFSFTTLEPLFVKPVDNTLVSAVEESSKNLFQDHAVSRVGNVGGDSREREDGGEL